MNNLDIKKNNLKFLLIIIKILIWSLKNSANLLNINLNNLKIIKNFKKLYKKNLKLSIIYLKSLRILK